MTPDEHTRREFHLAVGHGHKLWVMDWGNPQAKQPVIYLHGGPGSGTSDSKKDLFDPERQRVIFFDQRGAGQSTPYGSLEHNTAADLVEDISRLADHLGLKKFILTGGSWGSSLGLFYGIAHPERVAGMVLHGIWTCSQAENDWVDRGGFRVFFPEAWERYTQSVPETHRDNPSGYHFPHILGSDKLAMRRSAYEYNCLEYAALKLDDRFAPDSFETFDPASIRIEVHYLAHQCFVPDRYISDHATELTMPIWLVQGRQDMLCPPRTAYELSQLLPKGHLVWTTSGHKAERESWNVQRLLLQQMSGAV